MDQLLRILMSEINILNGPHFQQVLTSGVCYTWGQDILQNQPQ